MPLSGGNRANNGCNHYYLYLYLHEEVHNPSVLDLHYTLGAEAGKGQGRYAERQRSTPLHHILAGKYVKY